MIKSLSSRPSIRSRDAPARDAELVDRISVALEGESVLDDCLDVLVDFLGANRGLVVVTLPDGTTTATYGRDLAPAEREEIRWTIVRHALETGECVVYRPEHAASRSVAVAGSRRRARSDVA